MGISPSGIDSSESAVLLQFCSYITVVENAVEQQTNLEKLRVT